MNENIELRDFFAAQLMSSKVNDLYDAARRENVGGKEKGKEEWRQLTSDEATQQRINNAAKMAYRIADSLLKARTK